MAHVGEELALGLRRLLRLRLGAAELAHQLRRGARRARFSALRVLELARVRASRSSAIFRSVTSRRGGVDELARSRYGTAVHESQRYEPSRAAIAVLEPSRLRADRDSPHFTRRLAIVRMHEVEIRRGAAAPPCVNPSDRSHAGLRRLK